MKDFNTVVEHGNLTRSVDLRFTNQGQAIAKFGMAVNHSKKVGNKWEDEAHFFDVVCFGQLAENVAESVDKGDRVLVAGRLTFDQWEKEGVKHSRVRITADTVAVSLSFAVATVNRNERRSQQHAPPPSDAAPQLSEAYDYDTDPFA